MSSNHVRLVLASLLVLPVFGCVAASEPGAEPQGSKEEALTQGVTDPGDGTDTKTVKRLPFPPPKAQYCPALPTDPVCSEYVLPLPTKYDAELAGLGCSRAFYVKDPGNWYIDHIVAALCPVGSATEAAAAHHAGQMLNDAFCSPCIPKAPLGQTYVFLESTPLFGLPGCPSGCGRTTGG